MPESSVSSWPREGGSLRGGLWRRRRQCQPSRSMLAIAHPRCRLVGPVAERCKAAGAPVLGLACKGRLGKMTVTPSVDAVIHAAGSNLPVAECRALQGDAEPNCGRHCGVHWAAIGSTGVQGNGIVCPIGRWSCFQAALHARHDDRPVSSRNAGCNLYFPLQISDRQHVVHASSPPCSHSTLRPRAAALSGLPPLPECCPCMCAIHV